MQLQNSRSNLYTTPTSARSSTRSLAFFSLLLVVLVFPHVVASADTCERTFVTSKCSQCENAIFSIDDTLQSICPPPPAPDAIVNSYSPAGINTTELDNFCLNMNDCNETKYIEFYKQLEQICEDELNGDVNMFSGLLSIISDGFWNAYFMVPRRHSVCLKDSNGDYCTSDQLTTAWSVVGDRNGNASTLYVFAQIPPLGTITYGTNYHDRRDIPFPQDTICGDCFARAVSIFENYTNSHNVSSSQVQSLLLDDVSSGRQAIDDSCSNLKTKKRYWNEEYSMANAGMRGVKAYDVMMWWKLLVDEALVDEVDEVGLLLLAAGVLAGGDGVDEPAGVVVAPLGVVVAPSVGVVAPSVGVVAPSVGVVAPSVGVVAPTVDVVAP
ncbi:6561_t:CDS:2 [Paraglomus occultum]|uniref:6561_t:CDS:1 n=1 Tax=Paraglomus occultum TaxID=144539 RepID=A0A9N8VD53_9GLOM|nr:6561_t:CDS:2 [Paraglomus occultum]